MGEGYKAKKLSLSDDNQNYGTPSKELHMSHWYGSSIKNGLYFRVAWPILTTD